MRIKDNVKSVYTQIIVLCEIFHISFLFIFKHFSMQIPFMYNIGSVIFYILMLFVVLKGYYRVCIVLVHLEVSAFVTVTVLNGGYSSDFALYLISMATFVYFNPFKHRSVYRFDVALRSYLLGGRSTYRFCYNIQYRFGSRNYIDRCVHIGRIVNCNP